MAQIKCETFWRKFIFMLLFVISVESHLDVANCIDNLDDSIKISFDCRSNLSDVKNIGDAKIVELKACNEFPLGSLIKDSPWIFIVSIEGNLTESEVRNFLNDLETSERQLLVNFKRNEGAEENYRTNENQKFVKVEADRTKSLRKIVKYFSIDDFLIFLAKRDFTKSESYEEKSILKSIKSQCTLCLRFAQLVRPKFMESLKIYEDKIDDQKCDTECFKSILDLPFNFNFTEIPPKVLKFLHQTFINDIKSIRNRGMGIGHNNYTLENFLNKTEIKMNLEGLSALALQNDELQVFEFLIRADCPFPQNYTASDKSYAQKLNDYVKEVKKFHEFIKIGDYAKVEEILRKHPNLIFVRNSRNKGALQVAFENKQCKIFSLLKAHNFELGSLQDISDHYELRSKLDKNARKKIREINKKFIKPVIELDVIDQLMQQSFITMTSNNFDHEKIQTELRKAYSSLNEIVPDILKVIAAAKNFELIYDFDNSIVDDFDPSQTYNAGSAFHKRDYALVAAKGLIEGDKYDRNHVLATIAHELAHVAMNILYDNRVNPYVLDDEENYQKFNEIAKDCERKKDETSLMKVLFSDPEVEDLHGEVIARAPDFLLNYANRTRLSYVKEVYKPLFDFYNEKVLKDMQSMHPTMEARVRIQDLNKWLELVEEIKRVNKNSLYDFDEEQITFDPKVQIFITNHTKSLLRKIYVKAMRSKEVAAFLKSSFALNEHFREALYEIDKVRADVLLVIYCDDKFEDLKRFKEMFDKLAVERIIFVVKEVNKEKVLGVDFGEKVVKVF